MAKEKTIEVTPQLIEEWKEKYGSVMKLTTEDGRVAFVHDICKSVSAFRLHMANYRFGLETFARGVLNNCMIHGDESIQADYECSVGLKDQIAELMEDLPEAKVTEQGDKMVMTYNGLELEVKPAGREQIEVANQKDDKKPLSAEIELLKLIALDKSQLEEIKKNERAYIGFLLATEKTKKKKLVRLEKL